MKSIISLLTRRSLLSMTGEKSALVAAQAMHRARVGCVLVVDEGGTPLGIFTERDLMTRVVVPGVDPEKVRLADVMSEDLLIAGPEARVNDVAKQMQSRHIRHLPVVGDGKVLGILSLRDLLRELLAAKRQEVQALTAYIQGESKQL